MKKFPFFFAIALMPVACQISTVNSSAPTSDTVVVAVDTVDSVNIADTVVVDSIAE